MELQTIFFEKIGINLIRKLQKSYGYDKTLNQFLQYRAYVYTETGPWYEGIIAKQNEYRKVKKRRAKLADEFDFPLAPSDYLDQTDIDNAVGYILKHNPLLEADFRVEDNVTMLGDLLELSEVERLILQFSMYNTGRMGYPWDSVLAAVGASSEYDEPARLYEAMFGIDEAEIQKAMDGFLFNSGLVIPQKRAKNMHCVAPEMTESFMDRNLSAGSLSDSLFPSCLDTDLTTNNYPHLKTEIERAESIIDKSLEQNSKGINLMFWGIPGTGKTELALALAKKNGWDLKVIGDSNKQDMSEKSRAQRLTSLKIAMKLYQNHKNTVLLFDEMEDLFKVDTNATFSKAFINRIIETTPIPIIWTTNELNVLGNAVLRRMTYNIGFEVPPRDARKKIWEGYAEKHGVTLDSVTIDELATNYDIAPALISNAVKIAKLADLEGREAFADVVKSLDRLVNYGMKRRFQAVEVKDTPYNASWVNSKTDLNDLTGRLMRCKPNFSLLLYGAPGTGKSEYTRYVAKQMGKRVSYKRASDLISMWVGQTEANIARAFEEAKNEEMFLIIDEGDTFLRNRELARNSWEISQTNEMLAQMENHTQPFALTTNLMSELDPASMRRFTFKFEFMFLRPEQSLEIFEAYFGVPAPAKLTQLSVLAPGDFAAVAKKAAILEEKDPEALYEMIYDECTVKPQFRKSSVGF